MQVEINIRKGSTPDWDGLAEVFHRAVRDGASLYTEAQRAAWSPALRAGPDWSLRMSRQSVRLAETRAGEPVGFMTTELNGYFDCAYVLSAYQGQGLFRRLYAPLEAEQHTHGIKRLHVHASLHARAAFEAVGYVTVQPETVEMTNGVWLPRFSMEKYL